MKLPTSIIFREIIRITPNNCLFEFQVINHGDNLSDEQLKQFTIDLDKDYVTALAQNVNASCQIRAYNLLKKKFDNSVIENWESIAETC